MDQRSLMNGTEGNWLSNGFQGYLEWREEAGREFAATLEAASNGGEAAMQDLMMTFGFGRGGIRSGFGRGLAARGLAGFGRAVIGKLDDLKNLGAGERTLLDRLPKLGSPKANWYQNSSVLRQEMSLGQPIRDATVDSAGRLINNTGFLRAERNLLETHGWSYNQATRMWYPPAGP
jgi:hypothetical protein